jgi:Macrocin-O-methyltransferase (TylF)
MEKHRDSAGCDLPDAAACRENDLYIDLLKKCLCASIYDESAWQPLQGPMRTDVNRHNPFQALPAALKHAAIRGLSKRSLMLVRKKPFDARVRDEGLDWPCFGFTMVGRKRLDNVQHCVEDILARGVPGDLVETGVWRGGTTILMRAILKKHNIEDVIVWCADSFEGMPKPTTADLKAQANSDFSDRDYLAVSLEQVQANFERFGLLDDQVKFLKGWFRDTLPTAPIERIALLRMDGDLYSSSMDALTCLYPKVSAGGYVIVDDYNSWPACRQAVDEYRRDHGIGEELVSVDPHAVYWQVAGH